MASTDPLCHSASLVVNAPPAQAFAFLSDVKRFGEWALGCWKAEPHGLLLTGLSLFDGSRSYVKILPRRDALQIDFEIGSTPLCSTPRIVIRILPGADMALARDQCVISIVTWRSAAMDDNKWHQVAAAHDAEIFRIRYLVETAATDA